MKPLIDFTQGKIRHRTLQLHGSNELIAKAIGYKKNIPISVFDTTAGLGREAFLLAALGCDVTMFERHAQVADALETALQQASLDPDLVAITQRMSLHKICAIKYFTSEQNIHTPDIVYCDPMFPTRRKSALVKKEMQWLQATVGTDQDANTLVEIALKIAGKRVVVKRSKEAPSIQAPDVVFTARSHRFDVYITNK